jgi:hypothetical protein
METLTKQCTKCKEVKGIGEFGNLNRSKDGKANQCKACRKIIHSLSYFKNRDKTIKQYKEYRIRTKKTHKDSRSLSQKKSRLKRIEKLRKYEKDRMNKDVANTSDRYIKRLFISKEKLPRELITPELIECKRLIIKTKRLCKTLSN